MTLPFLISPPGDTPVILEGLLPASPERVFRAWTTPSEVTKWFGRATHRLTSAEIDLQVGGLWRFAFSADEALHGAYLAIEPATLLRFSWMHERRSPKGVVETTPTSQVSVSFEPRQGGAYIRLVHEALSGDTTRFGEGWSISLASMRELVRQERGESCQQVNP